MISTCCNIASKTGIIHFLVEEFAFVFGVVVIVDSIIDGGI